MSDMIIVNASNLHVGGGVQVASSLICELAIRDEARQISVWMSETVASNVISSGCNLNSFLSFRVFDVRGMSRLPSAMSDELSARSVIFTVFGPLYQKVDAFSVVGFAQPWIIYPKNECYAKLNLVNRFKFRVKFFLQKWFFEKNSDVLVVEANHVRRQLTSIGVMPPEKIHVVSNAISRIYQDGSLWSDFSVQTHPERISIGFIGRNYPHKNVNLIPEVKKVLRRKYSLDVDFYVTFSAEEWDHVSDGLRAAVKNVGVLRVVDCPGYYLSMDGVFFPSLLECFSATPLEAMVMNRPVFSSDRPFNRDVAAEHAFYFDPMSAESAADTIYNYFSLPENIRNQRLDQARMHAVNFSSASGRAGKYLEIIFNGVNRVQE